MSKQLIEVSHDLRTGTLTLTHLEDEERSNHGYSPLQIEDFKLAAGEHAQKYIDLAGWTPEYSASVKKKEEDEAAEKQALADAEAAKAKADKEAAEKAAFDAEVARQVKILEAAKKIVAQKG